MLEEQIPQGTDLTKRSEAAKRDACDRPSQIIIQNEEMSQVGGRSRSRRAELRPNRQPKLSETANFKPARTEQNVFGESVPPELQTIDLTSLPACQYKDEIGDRGHVVPHVWHQSGFSESEYDVCYPGTHGRLPAHAFIIKRHPK
jgi:hypothetical protein